MKVFTPERQVELEKLLNDFLEESIGGDDAFLCIHRDDIECRITGPRFIPKNTPHNRFYIDEFREMAETLIEKLAREPWELKCELSSVWRNGFTLTVLN